jgi:hypothetical protein
MSSIFYPESEALFHKDSQKQMGSLLWKLMYKRVQKNLDKNLINIENFKKILFNTKFENPLVLEKLPLPLILRQNQSLHYEANDGKQYFIPHSIAFCSQNIRFDIVLIEGEIELRNTKISDEEVLLHRPMLLVKNLKILEECFMEVLKAVE